MLHILLCIWCCFVILDVYFIMCLIYHFRCINEYEILSLNRKTTLKWEKTTYPAVHNADTGNADVHSIYLSIHELLSRPIGSACYLIWAIGRDPDIWSESQNTDAIYSTICSISCCADGILWWFMFGSSYWLFITQ